MTRRLWSEDEEKRLVQLCGRKPDVATWERVRTKLKRSDVACRAKWAKVRKKWEWQHDVDEEAGTGGGWHGQGVGEAVTQQDIGVDTSTDNKNEDAQRMERRTWSEDAEMEWEWEHEADGEAETDDGEHGVRDSKEVSERDIGGDVCSGKCFDGEGDNQAGDAPWRVWRPWSANEKQRLVRFCKMMPAGGGWERVCKELNRTEKACRHKWREVQKKAEASRKVCAAWSVDGKERLARFCRMMPRSSERELVGTALNKTEKAYRIKWGPVKTKWEGEPEADAEAYEPRAREGSAFQAYSSKLRPEQRAAAHNPERRWKAHETLRKCLELELAEARAESQHEADARANEALSGEGEIVIVVAATVVAGAGESGEEERPAGDEWTRLAELPGQAMLDVGGAVSEAPAPLHMPNSSLRLAAKPRPTPAVAVSGGAEGTSTFHKPVPRCQLDPLLADWSETIDFDNSSYAGEGEFGAGRGVCEAEA